MQGNTQGATVRSPLPNSTSTAVRGGGGNGTRTVAIIGAGFSGTTLAIQLLRQADSAPLRIVLVDPREEIGAGVAYATRDYPYPLNVAAGQMSLDSASPRDFLEFLELQGIHAAAGDFLPRQVYGEYLRARFDTARAAAASHVTCAHQRASVLQLRRAQGGAWDLWLDDGTALRADDVVLALGNPPPATLPALASIAASDRYVRDPWSIGSLANQKLESVLLLGSGLTMIDAALRLAAIRPRVHHIRVLSRHGWLPQAQATEHRPAIKPHVVAPLNGAHGSALELLRVFHELVRNVESRGGDWREVIALVRGRLPEIWQDLDVTQRARFLRHARSLWDVHRHRVPAGPLGAVQSLARKGVLEVCAGRMESANLVDDGVEVFWRPRGAQRSRAWIVDRVVNCTGPDSRVANHADPLVQSLIANGWIRPDAHGLGIDVAPDGRTLARDGTPVEGLFYIGPWLRARDWEATAVPELREHARALARRLAHPAAAVKAAT